MDIKAYDHTTNFFTTIILKYGNNSIIYRITFYNYENTVLERRGD